MDNTTTTAAPLTRRQAREIERRTGVRPVASIAPQRHDTGEIERNEVTALISVLPTGIVQELAAAAPAVETVDIPESFDGRGISVRAAVPAPLVAARRRRRAGAFAAAASITAITGVGLTAAGADTVVAADHQANLLTAAAPADADAAVLDEDAAAIAPAPEVAVEEQATVVETVDAESLFGIAGQAPVVETPAVEETSTGTGEVAAAEPAAAPSAPSAAGPLASGIVAAAYAQIGTTQDCTDMVQNALAAMGLTTRRDQGGYDYGISTFEQHGYRVSPDEVQPGDILIAYGYHVAIYTGDGVNHMAVHGGWNGAADDTVESSHQASPYFYDTIIRVTH
ncbi:MAG: C40 family peptidase [Microbacteriaceae bacterium]|nr:C40 family peptidase [Microbacteriaceae bacterium]